jgi:hypothetical protein
MIKADFEHGNNVDKRIIENKLRRGQINENDVKEYLSNLPDLSGYTDDLAVDDKNGKAI